MRGRQGSPRLREWAQVVEHERGRHLGSPELLPASENQALSSAGIRARKEAWTLRLRGLGGCPGPGTRRPGSQWGTPSRYLPQPHAGAPQNRGDSDRTKDRTPQRPGLRPWWGRGQLSCGHLDPHLALATCCLVAEEDQHSWQGSRVVPGGRPATPSPSPASHPVPQSRRRSREPLWSAFSLQRRLHRVF